LRETLRSISATNILLATELLRIR